MPPYRENPSSSSFVQSIACWIDWPDTIFDTIVGIRPQFHACTPISGGPKEPVTYADQAEPVVRAFDHADRGLDREGVAPVHRQHLVEPPLGTVHNYPIRPWHDAEY